MSSKETVMEFVSKLPEEMPLAEIARKIELFAGIQTAREQAQRGEGISAQDARKLVDALVEKDVPVVKPIRTQEGFLMLPVKVSRERIRAALRAKRDAG